MEEAVLVTDMSSFLRQDALRALEHIKNSLEDAETRWMRLHSQDQATGKSMKVLVKSEGAAIVEAEIELNLRRGYLVNTKLAKACVLDQLLEFHSILHKQCCKIGHAIDVLSKQLHCDGPESDGIEDLSVLLYHTFQILKAISHELHRAGDAVRLPSKRKFPYCTQLDHQYNPPLPSDILLDFSLHQARVLVEAFVVAPSTKPVDTNLSNGTKKEFVGQVTQFRGQTIEIMRQTSVYLDIAGLEELLVTLDEQVALLCHIRNNADALLQCYPDYVKHL
ncbi:hypothetical protein THRCLA_04985 [Thraustotheca clavata]|uniref:Uncharacterized protein n=1 Tax=Thraustotheca clavata TaxID=74557 RepID=A0A1V9ZXA3_9STRA|nr:hypothetical protein THRCLA_04985 [Thraustotheca clavata]